MVRLASVQFSCLHRKSIAKIQFSADRIVDQEVPTAFPENASFVDQVGSVDQFERLAGVVIGDENGEAGLPEFGDDGLNFVHRDGVNAGEWLIQHDEARLSHERASDCKSTFLSTGTGQGDIVPNMSDAETLEKFVAALDLFFPRDFESLHHGHDVFLDGEFSENRFFLRQITHPEASAFVHRHVGNVVPVEEDLAIVGRNESDDHVEAGRFSGSIRSE